VEEDFPGTAFSLFQSGSQKINPPGKEKETLANMKTTTPPVKNSMKHSSRDCGTVAGLLIPLVLVCFALLPIAQAVGPDTDGSIPGSNNGEGIGVLVSRTTGVWNTGTGFEALNHLTAGNQNTATGLRALSSDTNGGFNTATGVFSLFSNTSGFFNSATGAYSLANNVSGNDNTANGYAALYRNTGSFNTATGYAALYHNTTGVSNTANGSQALFSNTIGSFNTATGYQALLSNIGGQSNTAYGWGALLNSTGSHNIAVGPNAGLNLTTGNDNIDIGSTGAAADDSTIRIGSQTAATFISGISGVTVAGTPVVVAGNGQLGVAPSSARFKDKIKPMDRASEAVFALKPVTFRYKQTIDPKATAQFGLVAEAVAKVNPDLVSRDAKGELYTVRYDAVNAMLLNEFLKEHRKVEELKSAAASDEANIAKQEATIAQLKSTVAQQQQVFQATVAQLTARLNKQESQIQKVSAQLEVKKPAPRTVLNDQ
jgi:uncharacterized coiled-coil protein SlyX